MSGVARCMGRLGRGAGGCQAHPKGPTRAGQASGPAARRRPGFGAVFGPRPDFGAVARPFRTRAAEGARVVVGRRTGFEAVTTWPRSRAVKRAGIGTMTTSIGRNDTTTSYVSPATTPSAAVNVTVNTPLTGLTCWLATTTR